MTTEPGFSPVFGPNGAVLNAPTMTPEMRAKFWRPVGYDGMRSRYLVLIPLMFVMSSDWPFRETLLASTWWWGVFTGAVAMLALLGLWWFGRIVLKRWEFLARGERTLVMPAWSRAVLAATDISMGACVLAFYVAYLTDFKHDYFVAVVFAASAFLVSAMAGWFMRWLGDELKWTWRAKARTA